MSAICSSCEKTCREPEAIWYLGTRYGWNVYWACGACVDRIPEEERHPTERQMEFEVTFGPLKCETNSRGVYQGTTSKQQTPRFWVRNDAIAKFMPEGEKFLHLFYPFNNLDDYLPWFASGVRSGEIPKSGQRESLLRDLTLLGPVIERRLFGPRTLQRKSVIPYDTEVLSEQQVQQATELLHEILKRY
jgi:hypothetical protein